MLASIWESSSVNGVPQPITEITRTYTHGPGIDNHLSFYYQHVQDGTLVEARTYYYGKNHKDIVLITNPSRAMAEDYEYDPWGMGSFGPLNYAAYAEIEWDGDIFLYNMRRRLYDPILGHFIQKADFHFFEGSYVYKFNDPISSFDKTGFLPSNAYPGSRP